jgi:hypothetical protein
MKLLAMLGFAALTIAPSVAVAAPATSVGIGMSGVGTFALPPQPDMNFIADTPAASPAQEALTWSAKSSVGDATKAPAPNVSPAQDCSPAPSKAVPALCD